MLWEEGTEGVLVNVGSVMKRELDARATAPCGRR